LHPYPYSSKFAAFIGERAQQVRRALAQERGRGTAGRRQRQFGRASVSDCDAHRQRSRQRLFYALLKRSFALSALQQLGHCRVAREDLMQVTHGCRNVRSSLARCAGRRRREVI
jgi:hypothetical protein